MKSFNKTKSKTITDSAYYIRNLLFEKLYIDENQISKRNQRSDNTKSITEYFDPRDNKLSNIIRRPRSFEFWSQTEAILVVRKKQKLHLNMDFELTWYECRSNGSSQDLRTGLKKEVDPGRYASTVFLFIIIKKGFIIQGGELKIHDLLVFFFVVVRIVIYDDLRSALRRPQMNDWRVFVTRLDDVARFI